MPELLILYIIYFLLIAVAIHCLLTCWRKDNEDRYV